MFINTIPGPDDVYCSLNMTKDDCLVNSKNNDCCWFHFDYNNRAGWYTPPIDQCFDWSYMVRSAKFVLFPDRFNTVSDSEFCTFVGTTCESIQLDNFKDVWEFVRVQEKLHIYNWYSLDCRNSQIETRNSRT